MRSLLYRLGSSSARRPWRVIAGWAVLAVLVVATSLSFGAEQEDSFSAPGVDSERAVALLSSTGSDRAGITARVVLSADEGTSFTGTAALSDLDLVREEIAVLPKVLAVDEAISPDEQVAVLSVQYPVIEKVSARDLDRLKASIEKVGSEVSLQIEAGGELFFTFEEAPSQGYELIGIGAAVLILLLAFGSVIAMCLPIGIALFGLTIGVSAMPLISHFFMIPSWVPGLGAMIGIGVGIDYALLVVTRHRELLSEGLEVTEAAARATATAGRAVVFAGGTVVIAILGLALAGLPFIAAAGVAISVIVLVLVAASITLLPAFLGVSGHWINRFGIHRRGHTTDGAHGAGWRRWGGHVTRHAWPYTIGVTALLLALTAPVLALQLGVPDEGTMGDTRTERRAYDLAAEGFGPGINGPLVIAVDLADDEQALEPLLGAIEADPGIAGVALPEISDSGDVATIVALPTTAPQDDATFATVQRLRSEAFPPVLQGTELSAHIGGQTATFGDVASRVSDRLPVFIAAVVGLSFLLLMMVFRSVLVPLKAAVMNLLSIGAAYGALVMVFQWGWGAELIGLEGTVPIMSFIPMFMFAVLFGLSMDYEVFLLSRVREHYETTGDNDQAVVAGLADTARVITSAALIMICVFVAFALGDDPVVKMMGLGLAAAIFIDATVVRIVLVPATMKLMGRANWWLPGWLDRLLPTVIIDSGPSLGPQPATMATSLARPDDERPTVNSHLSALPVPGPSRHGRA